MEVTETHAYIYTFEVEAESKEDAIIHLENEPYDYELDYECYDTIDVDRDWSSLTCTHIEKGKQPIVLSDVLSYPEGGEVDD